jgi:hypothetical protein
MEIVSKEAAVPLEHFHAARQAIIHQRVVHPMECHDDCGIRKQQVMHLGLEEYVTEKRFDPFAHPLRSHCVLRPTRK